MKNLLTSLFFLFILLITAQAQTPIAFYPFNGNADDAIGSNDGTVNGATLTEDRFGNANSAYSFDGLDDVIGFNSPFTKLSIILQFPHGSKNPPVLP